MVRKPPTDSQHYCQTYDWRSLQMIPALSSSSSWSPRSGESEKWKWKSLSHTQLLATPWNSLGQNTGVGSLSIFQGIFPTQGLNPDLPHCRQNLCQLSHQGSPRILEWVAYPFSSGSSWPRNWTGVSCFAGRFFTSWATRVWCPVWIPDLQELWEILNNYCIVVLNH